jgi:AraC-like DNA-binding protein
LAARAGRSTVLPPDSRQGALRQRIYAFIEHHLGDTELSPGTVARAHHISLRYPHKLFETQDSTVSEWIRRRRLEHCLRDLGDPALHHRTVSAIGARWGFTNPAHFSRAFRQAFGMAPGQYRSEHVRRS